MHNRRYISPLDLRMVVPLGAVLLLLAFATGIHGQSDPFGATRLSTEIRKAFKLNSREFAAIQSLINQENGKVVQIYARFGGEEPEYSGRMWNLILARRMEFEAEMPDRLSNRQKTAVRGARARVERRVLNYIVNDYVSFLAANLELGDDAYDEMASIFTADYRKKSRVINDLLFDPGRLREQMGAVSSETEIKVKKALSDYQWHDYKRMTQPEGLFAVRWRFE